MIFYPNSGCDSSMKLVLAMDLRHNTVVHGQKGERAGYRPLDWGCSPTAEPVGFVQEIAPDFLYIADLDRIEGTGSHDAIIHACAEEVSCCYVDRGCRSPGDFLDGKNIKNIVGTETGGSGLGNYREGFLSVDVKDNRVIPSGENPVDFLSTAGRWDFEGCILLNVSSVGTEEGVNSVELEKMRTAYNGELFYGGGVKNTEDLEILCRAGFDGAIIATALHRGAVPLEWIRRGNYCL
jgi:phosphoribosylformimino-5-aminoimidazole carboxamide ribotide isomerase